jgi:oligoribonuclease NrnB/cAMP/cGMP phosphodiesterase (DHH superfamily)
MKCFYHSSDLDGICSAAIVKYRYPECELIAIDYDYNHHIFDSVSVGETVFMVDFSALSEHMRYLKYHTDFIWIDHHKTAIEKCSKLEPIAGIREIGKAACELTWEYLFPNKTMPEAVRLLGRYDVWDHSDPNTLPWQYGMRQY